MFAHHLYLLSCYHLATTHTLDSSLSFNYCARYQVFVCMYVC